MIVISIISLFFTDIFNNVINLSGSILKKNNSILDTDLMIKHLSDDILHSINYEIPNSAQLKLMTFDNSISDTTEAIAIIYTFNNPYLYKYHSYFNDTSYFSQEFDNFVFLANVFSDTLISVEYKLKGEDIKKINFTMRN